MDTSFMLVLCFPALAGKIGEDGAPVVMLGN